MHAQLRGTRAARGPHKTGKAMPHTSSWLPMRLDPLSRRRQRRPLWSWFIASRSFSRKSLETLEIDVQVSCPPVNFMHLPAVPVVGHACHFYRLPYLCRPRLLVEVMALYCTIRIQYPDLCPSMLCGYKLRSTVFSSVQSRSIVPSPLRISSFCTRQR